MTFEAKITPWQRLSALKEAIDRKGFVRMIEAHSGISGLVGETVRIERDGEPLEFDGFWESSLTDSTSKGLPDVELIGSESRLHTIDEILTVTTKPMIVDGDTGGEPDAFRYLVQRLERRGVSAVIIEDKVFPKRNSLDAMAEQVLEDPAIFAEKIGAGKEAQVTPDFMVIARLESLIAGRDLADALGRAEVYIRAGADGIMIHSKRESPAEILAFAEAYPDLCDRVGRRPVLVSVPTTYNSITDRELVEAGFNVVIHANHLMRAAHKSMNMVAELILRSDRSFEADEHCSPVRELFATVGYERIVERDRQRSEARRPSEAVIIPAAGRDPEFPERPKSLIEIGGKYLIDHQLDAIERVGLKNIVVVRGHQGHQFEARLGESELVFLDNPEFDKRHSLYSLFCAREHMKRGFVMLYSDILFSSEILAQLIDTGRDIVLAVDSSYQYHEHEIDKRLDLVHTTSSLEPSRRRLRPTGMVEVTAIGKGLDTSSTNQEFIGMAYFSEQGARLLQEVYEDCLATQPSPFHEAPSIARAGVTDIIQELIDRGVPVCGQEVYKGWIEVHSREDVATAEREVTAAAAI